MTSIPNKRVAALHIFRLILVCRVNDWADCIDYNANSGDLSRRCVIIIRASAISE